MSVSLREMLARLVSFAKRQERDDEFQEELNAHLQIATDEYRRRGVSAEEARRKALINLGGAAALKELHRDTRGMAGVASVLKDLRYAFRQLYKGPAFAATAVLSLALGIGGTTGIFSLVYSVLLHPYPYAGADRMVRLSIEDKSGNVRPVLLAGSEVQAMRSAEFVDDAIASQNWELNTTGSDLPEDVKAGLCYAECFDVLRLTSAARARLEAIRRFGEGRHTGRGGSHLFFLATALPRQNRRSR